jgi:hypothetical protein
MSVHIKKAMQAYLEGKLEYHKANWNVFMENTVGVAEHGNFMETLEKELEQIAKYSELLQAMEVADE